MRQSEKKRKEKHTGQNSEKKKQQGKKNGEASIKKSREGMEDERRREPPDLWSNVIGRNQRRNIREGAGITNDKVYKQ